MPYPFLTGGGNSTPHEVQPLGSLFRRIDSGVSSIPFDSGNTRTIELPKSFLIKRSVLRLTGSWTVGVAAATAVGTESPLALIKQIEILADGRKTLFRAAGKDLFRLTHLFNGKRPELTAPSTAVGTNAFAATIFLDHAALRFVKPLDSFLDPRGYEKLELRITWGTLADIGTAGGGGTLTLSAATSLDVQVEQTTEGEDHILFNKIVTFIEKDVTATSSNMEITLPRIGTLVGIFLRTERDASAVNNIVNKVTLKSDNNFAHFDLLNFATVQRKNVVDFQLDGGGGTDGEVTGYAYFDLTEDGLISAGLATTLLNELKLVLDVTKTGGTEIVRAILVYMEPAIGRPGRGY